MNYNQTIIVLCLISAVRLGRCPKKDRPSKSSFMYMPQNDTLDLDRQVRTEQMVLTVHDAYRKACQDFDEFSILFTGPNVCMGYRLFITIVKE